MNTKSIDCLRSRFDTHCINEGMVTLPTGRNILARQMAAIIAALLWRGRPLLVIQSSTADGSVGLHLIAIGSWQHGAGVKNPIELPPSEGARQGGRRVAVHVKNVHTTVVFCVASLK